jgi:hypothetical protein
MPYVHIDIDPDEFEDDELIEELESRGYFVIQKDGSTNSLGDLGHIEHLVICGQIEHARAEALLLVGRSIGRPL